MSGPDLSELVRLLRDERDRAVERRHELERRCAQLDEYIDRLPYPSDFAQLKEQVAEREQRLAEVFRETNEEIAALERERDGWKAAAVCTIDVQLDDT